MSVLVSRTLWKYQELMFSCGHVFNTHPYRWNKEMKRGELCKSRWRIAMWYLNVGFTVVYSIYLLIRATQINFDEESSKTKKTYMKFIVFYYAFPALFQTSIWVHLDDLAPFNYMNSTSIRVYEELILTQDEDENPWDAESINRPTPKCRVPKFMDVFFDFVWYGFLGIIPFIGLINIARPHSQEFISSLLAPDSGVFRWPMIITSAIFHMYFAFTFMVNSFLFIYQGFLCGIPTLLALIQIKNWIQIDKDRISRARVIRIIYMYRSAQIIVKALVDCFCDLTIPASKMIMISLCIFCAYGTIKIGGYLAMFLGAVGILASGVLVPMISALAMADTLSRECLQLMKEPRFYSSLTLGQKKDVKSLEVIQCKMRRSYVLDKECVKTVYRIIVDSTVDILLST